MLLRAAFIAFLGIAASGLAWPGEPAEPEELVRGRQLTGCAFALDGQSILFSGRGDAPREIRRLSWAELEEDGPGPLWFSERTWITWGVSPLPFGKKMMFVRRGSKRGGLWIHDFDSQEETQLRRDPFMGLPPTISGDGKVIMAYRWAGRSKRIGVVNPETGKFKSIPGKDLSYPALNVSGKRLLFIREGQVWLRELPGGEDTEDKCLTSGELTCSWPSWGPREREMTFVACAEDGIGKIGAVKVPTLDARWLVENLREPRSPVFSPDGKWLAFISKSTDEREEDILWRLRLRE